MSALYQLLSWTASIASIVGASVISADFGRRPTGWGFVVIAVGSVLWIIAGFLAEQSAITAQNMILLAINLWGVYRWLIRRGNANDSNQSAVPADTPVRQA